jgi:hypothetical protein
VFSRLSDPNNPEGRPYSPNGARDFFAGVLAVSLAFTVATPVATAVPQLPAIDAVKQTALQHGAKGMFEPDPNEALRMAQAAK